MTGWHGRVLKDWTALGTFVVGSGLPETPVYLAATPGTGFTGYLRPDRTTQSLSAAPAGSAPRGSTPAPMSRPQEAAMLRGSCGPDYRMLCRGVQPGGGRVVACLEANRSALSAGCQAALAGARPPR